MGTHSLMRCVSPPASIGIFTILSLLCLATPARAEDPISDFSASGGLAVAMPVALPAGMSTGLHAAGTWGETFALGARAAWSRASEHTTSHTVAHDDIRLSLLGAARHRAGRGTMALRLGLGGILVRETRTRDQGMRAGLTGDELKTSALRWVPSAELELAVSLQIRGAWGIAIAGGPSIHVDAGSGRFGWIGTAGVTWQP